ncbi:hypothetical protein LZ31DRAFT_32610 [Colletotrichum somersetense]|nr:hypothetical protein LZ31DRAFT_32610 [Colletotrichum somersetense]
MHCLCVDRSRTRRLGSHSIGRNRCENAETGAPGERKTRQGDQRIRDSTPPFPSPRGLRVNLPNLPKSTGRGEPRGRSRVPKTSPATR